MDEYSQMVFCTHLSYTADRERKKEGVRARKENKKKCLLIAKSVHCGLEQTSTV